MIKRKKWIPYGRKAESVEIKVKDNQNQMIDSFRVYKNKTRDLRRIIEKIKVKYNFDFNPEIKKDIEKERDWINKDSNWIGTSNT